MSGSTRLVSQHGIHEPTTSCFFLPFHKKQQIHGQLASLEQVRSRARHCYYWTLVISDTTPIEIPVASCQLEWVTLPPLWRCGDHIIMPVRILCGFGYNCREETVASPVEEDPWFSKGRLGTLEACEDDRIMYGRLVRIQLFDTLRVICQDIMGRRRYIQF
jgi:hypothetical protein